MGSRYRVIEQHVVHFVRGEAVLANVVDVAALLLLVPERRGAELA